MEITINPAVPAELVKLARIIANEQQYRTLIGGLQPIDDYTESGVTQPGLKSKYQEKLSDLERSREAERIWQYAEASNVLYYAACLDAACGGEYETYQAALTLVSQPPYGISQAEAECAALALYRLRAVTPYRKKEETLAEKADRHERENRAIQFALSAQQEKWPGWPLPEVAEAWNVPVDTLYALHRNGRLPSRLAEKTVLINTQDIRWIRWYASYRPRAKITSL
jgi:hypothetical protein